MLTLLLVSLYCLCGVSSACAPIDPDEDIPACNEEQVLTMDQVQQVDRNRVFDLENDPEAFAAARMNEKIIELTPEQIRAAIARNPDFFQSQKDLPPLPDDGTRRRRKRQIFPGFGQTQSPGFQSPFSVRKCPPNPSFAPISLAINGFGKLVQVVQPGGGNSQFVFDETCASPFDGVGETCMTTTRLVTAYVIDFDTYDFAVEWIEVSCCVTFS